MVAGSLAAQNIGTLVEEVMNGPQTTEGKKENMEDFINREKFNEKEEPTDEAEDLLRIDNKAATQILLQESGSWRTRHLRVRAAALKQRVEEGEQIVKHIPGRPLLAGLSTKSHPFGGFHHLRRLWGIKDVSQE